MDKPIFVVDDSITHLTLTAGILKERYPVMTIPSGEKAIALLEKVKPCLILLDIEMPGMDGFDVLKHLKSSEELRTIPVIFLTASIVPEMEKRALEMGVIDIMKKPFDPPALLDQISRLIKA